MKLLFFSLKDAEEQAMLEARHREEEDRLYRKFQEQREKEHSKVIGILKK